MIIVKLEHMRRLRYCSKGIRAFFVKYSLDYQKFLKEGIDAEELLSASNNDAMAKAVVEVANGQQ